MDSETIFLISLVIVIQLSLGIFLLQLIQIKEKEKIPITDQILLFMILPLFSFLMVIIGIIKDWNETWHNPKEDPFENV